MIVFLNINTKGGNYIWKRLFNFLETVLIVQLLLIGLEQILNALDVNQTFAASVLNPFLKLMEI